MTVNHYTDRPVQESFAQRLQLLGKEFGSRYALAKSSGIPASTLQTYESGAKPGMDALVTLARVANVDLTWLITGKGEMRPAGIQSGAVLKDVLMVDQYVLGSSLAMEMVIGHIPFSRNFLEINLRLNEPTHQTLLAVEAGSNLSPILRRDLVLIDRTQANFARDGIYLLELPGLELRAMFRRPDGKVDVIAPQLGASARSEKERRDAKKRGPGSMEMTIGDLFGIGPHAASKVIGRAVWVGRAI